MESTLRFRLIQALSKGRIMFGFVRVQDSTTSLPKFVLIQWVRRFKIS
jgi:hypothetical protein